MAIALGVILLAAGLVLVTDAVSLPSSWEAHINHDTLGWVLVVVGGLAIVLGLMAAYLHGRARKTVTTPVDEPLPADGQTVERKRVA